MIVPLLLGLSLWFRSASDRGYSSGARCIAVLSDVGEPVRASASSPGSTGSAQRAAPP
jgi:hypothetical protein